MKDKSVKTILILIVFNLIVYSAFSAMYIFNKNNSSVDTNIYISKKTTGDIVSIKCENSSSNFEINNNNGTWTLYGDSSFPINTSSVEKLLQKANNLIDVRLISSDGNYEKYGLDKPLQKITLTDINGTSVSYIIGNFNENINRYYVCEYGSKDIYIINKSVAETITQPLYSYAASYNLSELSKSSLLSIECFDNGKKTKIFKSEIDKENPMGSNSQWRFSEPFKNTFVDPNKIDFFISYLKKSAESQCVIHSPNESDIETLGIKDTQKYFLVKYKTKANDEKTAIMRIGNQNDDGSLYISFDGSNIIALTDADTGRTIMTYLDSYKFVSQSICAVKKDKIAYMEVSLNSQNYRFDFTENGYTLNGSQCSSDDFEAFFNKLSGIASASSSDEANIPTNENSFTITYHFKNTDYKDVYVAYTPFDSNYYTAQSGELYGRLVNKRSVESVINLLNTLIN